MQSDDATPAAAMTRQLLLFQREIGVDQNELQYTSHASRWQGDASVWTVPKTHKLVRLRDAESLV